MKTKRLALRVTLNSVLMILAVYLVMQTLGYFKDNIILGISDLSAFPATVFGFIGGSVLPPTVIFSVILYALAMPIQRVALQLEAGETLPPGLLEKTRRRILRFSRIVLAVNILGFAMGSILLLILTKRMSELFHFDRIVILTSNIAASVVLAMAQTSLDNLSFGPVRERLGIHEIGERKRERRSTTKQLILSSLLVLYGLTFIQFNLRDAFMASSVQADAFEAVRAGRVAPDGLEAEYRRILAERLPLFCARSNLDVASLPLPWERGVSYIAIEEKVFLIFMLFMLAVAFGVQAAVSTELRDQLSALARRLRDVLDGGGDLRLRLNLRAMDDIGELTELFNRLLGQFHGVASRISQAAGQTRDGAAAIDRVLGSAEGLSRRTAEAVLALEADLVAQAEESRSLALALDSFREAVSGVNGAADAQRRVVAETAEAMERMAESIRSVEAMTERAGKLTAELAERGGEGGAAVTETRAAIGEIEDASQRVLEVLSSLTKIAASTNLLAMNAAIEAAHAGENGLGFAVVADEVRSLATTAASETKAIKELISEMSDRIGKGVQRAESSGSVLGRLMSGLEESAGISSQIAGATRGQGEGTTAVQASLGQVVASCETIGERMAEQAAETDRMSASLENAMARLESLASSSHAQSEEVRALEESFAAVRREVDRNLAAVGELSAEIGRFKV